MPYESHKYLQSIRMKTRNLKDARDLKEKKVLSQEVKDINHKFLRTGSVPLAN